MPRGATTLFSDIIFSEVLPEKQEQGRSKTLIAKRNECLIDRYYFYMQERKWRYSYILEVLSAEFFISEVTIPKIMEKPENVTYLRSLKLKQLTKIAFEKKWPHMKWAA